MKKRNYNFITIFGLLILIFTLQSCEKEDFGDVYAEPGYAFGTITKYKSVPLKVTYMYDFEVASSKYTGEEVAKGIGQLDERLVGKSYLVVYKLSDINDNDLNFDYPIESQQEFDELVESFKTNPPKQD
ncbi:MAG: hypothetical protein ABIJ97_01255 [Bacteroidota bacterium]